MVYCFPPTQLAHKLGIIHYFCAMPVETQTEEETFTLDELLAVIAPTNRLILWNDEINTFDHVIHCLMKHLQYSEKQAGQIAWKVHNEGKCAVLEGSYTEMEIYRKILKSEGLTVSVE